MPRKVDAHMKKLVAPIVITSILILYLLGYIIICFLIPLPPILKIIGTLIPLAFIGVSISVLVERIKEVKGGEDDDLSKY